MATVTIGKTIYNVSSDKTNGKVRVLGISCGSARKTLVFSRNWELSTLTANPDGRTVEGMPKIVKPIFEVA